MTGLQVLGVIYTEEVFLPAAPSAAGPTQRQLEAARAGCRLPNGDASHGSDAGAERPAKRARLAEANGGTTGPKHLQVC